MFGHRLSGFRQSTPVPSNPVSTRSRQQRIRQQKRAQMSIEKDRNSEVEQIPKPLLSYYNPHAKLSNPLTGSMSSQTYLFSISTLGNQADNKLFTLNLSSLSPGTQTLLTIIGFKSFLLNYAATQFPSLYYLTSPSISGMYDQTGNQTNIVSATHITGGITTIVNAGGIIGFNLNYCSGEPIKSWDITGLNSIDFNLLIGHDKTSPVYPLSNEMTVQILVTRVQ